MKHITKTCLYNFDPLKPHFFIVKLGFTGVDIIFLISAQKHRLWVLDRTASLILSRNMKNVRVFLSENFQFLEVKFSIYLNRRVFVMQIINLTNGLPVQNLILHFTTVKVLNSTILVPKYDKFFDESNQFRKGR